MSRLVVVGEAPGGRGTEDLPALEGLVGRRLAKMLGISFEEWLEVDRRNVFESPDAGVPWRPDAAKMRALGMLGIFEPGTRVIVLGKRAGQAFGVQDFPLYQWVSFQRVMTGDVLWVANVPHPSGRNRVLNDPRERERMGRFLREAYADHAQR